ncbi:MAG TPA: hypothetical protein VGI85_07405 [Chthoniobacterales bacterium]|jgi:hypothetical protein
MKIAQLIALLFLAVVTPAIAQYEVRTSSDGFAVVSKVRGRTYTVDVPGKGIKTYGANSADHPYLMVDGRFLQVLSVPLAEFHASASASDEAVLKQQMKYESSFWHVAAVQPQIRKLPSGRIVLLWSLNAQGKRQIFCTTRFGSYVVVLGSAVEGDHSIKELQSWLMRIAGSLHAIS